MMGQPGCAEGGGVISHMMAHDAEKNKATFIQSIRSIFIKNVNKHEINCSCNNVTLSIWSVCPSSIFIVDKPNCLMFVFWVSRLAKGETSETMTQSCQDLHNFDCLQG